MKMKFWTLQVTSVAAVVFALGGLGGCVGDGGSAPTAITAADDSATVPWNATASVDVLANDSASQGTLTLESVATPAHGKAVVSGTAVEYTPDAGFFGSDAFTYTVQATDGTTATASVTVAVTAKVTVSGVVSDGPLGGAAVTVDVGNQTYTAKADDDGKYQVAVDLADPAAMVTVTATGAGVQSNVKLRSLLGDAQTIGALAASDGLLGSDRLASTNVSNVSTALAAVVEDANGGTMPASSAQLAAWLPMAPSQLLTDAATAIKLVADGHAALPAGVADTQALVAHPSTSSTLTGFLAAQRGADALNQYILTQNSLLTLGSLPGGTMKPIDATAKTVAYYVGSKKEALFAVEVTYATDGTAQVLGADGPHAATWSQAGDIVTISLAQPIEESTALDDPITNQFESAIAHTTGFQVVQLAGTSAAGVAIVQAQGSWTFESGVVAPFQPTLLASITGTVDLAAVTPLSASDFATGTLWGGLIVGRGDNDVPLEDILSITAAGSGTFLRTGQAATWSVVDGVLKVISAGVEYDYRRLTGAAAAGEEEWLASEIHNGAAVDVNVQMAAKVAAGLKFAADATVTRRWQSGVSYEFLVDLDAGGAGALVNGLPAVSTPVTWAVGADGTLTIVQPSDLILENQRVWTLLGRTANSILVMEHLTQNSVDYWRMNVYTDTGAATP